jgi:hypothetical protein
MFFFGRLCGVHHNIYPKARSRKVSFLATFGVERWERLDALLSASQHADRTARFPPRAGWLPRQSRRSGAGDAAPEARPAKSEKPESATHRRIKVLLQEAHLAAPQKKTVCQTIRNPGKFGVVCSIEYNGYG